MTLDEISLPEHDGDDMRFALALCELAEQHLVEQPGEDGQLMRIREDVAEHLLGLMRREFSDMSAYWIADALDRHRFIQQLKYVNLSWWRLITNVVRTMKIPPRPGKEVELYKQITHQRRVLTSILEPASGNVAAQIHQEIRLQEAEIDM